MILTEKYADPYNCIDRHHVVTSVLFLPQMYQVILVRTCRKTPLKLSERRLSAVPSGESSRRSPTFRCWHTCVHNLCSTADFCPKQPNVRSTTQRRGRTVNPRVPGSFATLPS